MSSKHSGKDKLNAGYLGISLIVAALTGAVAQSIVISGNNARSLPDISGDDLPFIASCDQTASPDNCGGRTFF